MPSIVSESDTFIDPFGGTAENWNPINWPAEEQAEYAAYLATLDAMQLRELEAMERIGNDSNHPEA